jgi:pyrrolidone-carboxylate peptidase
MQQQPFKSFHTNPSYLIAEALPSTLESVFQPYQKFNLTTSPREPQQQQQSPTPSPPLCSPYEIRLIVHPSPIRVSYATVTTLLPQLIAQHAPDYIFHIGMAGGREHYTLETIAHRDGYKIRDVDDRDGWRDGEFEWKREGVPEAIRVGWDPADVLGRWEGEVRRREEAMGIGVPVGRFGNGNGNGDGYGMGLGEWGVERRKWEFSTCRLSADAGRFLCEFTLFESLSRRWIEGEKGEGEDRKGKVAFLHVPGAFAREDVLRGVRVAEAAIRSLVASWEEGRRNELDGGGPVPAEGVESGRWDGVVWRS